MNCNYKSAHTLGCFFVSITIFMNSKFHLYPLLDYTTRVNHIYKHYLFTLPKPEIKIIIFYSFIVLDSWKILHLGLGPPTEREKVSIGGRGRGRLPTAVLILGPESQQQAAKTETENGFRETAHRYAKEKIINRWLYNFIFTTVSPRLLQCRALCDRWTHQCLPGLKELWKTRRRTAGRHALMRLTSAAPSTTR